MEQHTSTWEAPGLMRIGSAGTADSGMTIPDPIETGSSFVDYSPAS